MHKDSHRMPGIRFLRVLEEPKHYFSAPARADVLLLEMKDLSHLRVPRHHLVSE